MAPRANTKTTFGDLMIREDLQEDYTMISPTDTAFQRVCGTTTASSVLFEWPVVQLAAPNASNRVAEGESDLDNDDPTEANRLSNYTQISDKVAEVSHTSQAVNAAANNLQRMAKQISIKMQEMKRDKEVMLLSNIAATAASLGNPRASAGLPAFLRTNTIFETGGADPVLSATTDGFPSVAATAGTAPVLFAEEDLNQLIEDIWNEGGSPSMIMVNSGNKRRISQTFSGNASRYEDTTAKTASNTIDFYDSDFGMLSVVPNRFQPTNNADGDDDSYNVFVLDPEHLHIAYLDEVKQKPLAETGHSMRRLIWCEYGLQVDAENACGVIRDTSNLVA